MNACTWHNHGTAYSSLPWTTAESGQALPIALITLAVSVLLITFLVLAVTVYLQLASNDVSNLLDYYAADGGIERAIVPLTTNPFLYSSDTTLNATLNNRTVAVNVSPMGSQTIVEPVSGGPITVTIVSYLVTSRAVSTTIRSRVEARSITGQLTATVHIKTWQVGE